jgi:hypothetical protein
MQDRREFLRLLVKSCLGAAGLLATASCVTGGFEYSTGEGYGEGYGVEGPWLGYPFGEGDDFDEGEGFDDFGDEDEGFGEEDEGEGEEGEEGEGDEH